MPTWWVDFKKMQKKNFHGGFFFKSTLSVLRCTWTGRINLKIFLGYHINYLSIWPFMRHPWFPTRKASKLTFIYFQLQLLNTLQGLKSKSWKQTNLWIYAGKSTKRGFSLMSNDENKFQPIFQILHIKSAWFLLELAMALVTTIGMRFLQVWSISKNVLLN